MMQAIKTNRNLIEKLDIINILIVDDRPENLLTLESVIEKSGRNIIKASGGNEALKLAIKGEIGLILLDIQMPDIDGMEVASLLRSNNKTRHIPIVFVSAVSKSERPIIDNFEIGTVDCLYKPLDLEETKTKVAIFEKLYHSERRSKLAELEIVKMAKQHEQFVYIVSHDLKAPLRAIDNLANWIIDDLSGRIEPNTIENILLLRNRVNRITDMLSGILEYSRTAAIDEAFIEIDTNKLVHAIFESIEVPQGFMFKTENLPIILAEETRIYKIFYHLISNAIIHHHQPEIGCLLIACENSSLSFVFKIKDNGPGIKLQYHEEVFDLFKTIKSKDERESTGIGLTIVRQLLEKIGGKVWIENSEQEGATVSFTLPVELKN